MGIFNLIANFCCSNEKSIGIGIIIIASIYIIFLHVQKSTLYEEINNLVQIQSKQEVEINLLKFKENELNNIINLKNITIQENEKVISGLQDEVKNINDSNNKSLRQIAEYQKIFLKTSKNSAENNKNQNNSSVTKNENQITLINNLNKHFSTKSN